MWRAEAQFAQYNSAPMLILLAYAKVNLALDVVRQREDGNHDLDSLLVPIDWHDLVGLTIRPAETTRINIRVTGRATEGVPSGDDNLAARAAGALQRLVAIPLEIGVWLEKRVPHGAGLGGGSADAAAVLHAGKQLLTAFGIALTKEHLLNAALGVGSDVPALVARTPVRVGGCGDALTSVVMQPLHLAVVMTAPSSTAAVFTALTREEKLSDGRVGRLIDSLNAGPPPDELMGSTLENAAVRVNPTLGRLFEAIRTLHPGHMWHMTGTGGALFTVTRDASDADELAAGLRRTGFVARAVRTVSDPAAVSQ